MSSPHVSVQRGHTATLPCWLNPPQSAQPLEVLWHRSYDVDVSVMHYNNEKVSSPSSYEGRVSFGSRDVTSGGLAWGDVSLELVNVTLQDSGEYTCYVSSDQSHHSAAVTLAVTGECGDTCENLFLGFTQATGMNSVALPSKRVHRKGPSSLPYVLLTSFP